MHSKQVPIAMSLATILGMLVVMIGVFIYLEQPLYAMVSAVALAASGITLGRYLPREWGVGPEGLVAEIKAQGVRIIRAIGEAENASYDPDGVGQAIRGLQKQMANIQQHIVTDRIVPSELRSQPRAASSLQSKSPQPFQGPHIAPRVSAVPSATDSRQSEQPQT